MPGVAARARRRARAGQPVLRRGAAELRRRARGRPADAAALRSLELPGSLHSLVLSRIDTLSEAPRRTLKVASVVGRVFRAPDAARRLSGARDRSATSARTSATLRALDLVNVDREADESYLFKHAVTQEVAYESLPFALRATLHGDVGRYIEARSEPIDRNLDLLAHHFWHSDDEERKRAVPPPRRRRRAGDLRERRRDRLLRAPRAARCRRRSAPRCCSSSARCSSSSGAGTTRAAVESTALELARAAGDDAARRVVRGRAGRGRAQAGALRRGGGAARRARRACSPASATRRGVGRVLHLAGTLAAQQGGYAEARERYEESLAIRRRLGDRKHEASLLSNLGIVAEYEGDLDRVARASTSGRSSCARSSATAGRSGPGKRSSVRRRAAGALRRGTRPASRKGCGSAARSATTGSSRSATTTSATPTAGWATTRRRAQHYAEASRPTATTTNSGRWPSCSRTSRCSRRKRASRPRRSSWSAPPTRCARRSAARAESRAKLELDRRLAEVRGRVERLRDQIRERCGFSPETQLAAASAAAVHQIRSPLDKRSGTVRRQAGIERGLRRDWTGLGWRGGSLHFVVGVSVAAVAALPPRPLQAGPELVTNGGFETPTVTPSTRTASTRTRRARPTGFGWTVTGNSIDLIGPATGSRQAGASRSTSTARRQDELAASRRHWQHKRISRTSSRSPTRQPRLRRPRRRRCT